MDNCPEIRLISEAGTKNGDIRRAPRSRYSTCCLFDAWQPAYARADNDADAIGIGLGDFQARVAPRLSARSHAIMDERIHLLGFLGCHVLRDIEILDLTRYLGIKRRRIETR